MKIKQFFIGLIVIAVAAAGAFALLRWIHARQAPADDEEKAFPPVVSVQVGALKRMTLHRYLTAYGTVEPAPATATNPAAVAHLAAAVVGVVAKINAVEGQRVEKGDLFLELNSAGVTLKFAEEEASRQEKLYAQQNTSLRNVQTAEAQLAVLRVTVPLSGTVTHLNVVPGAAVDVNTVAAEIVDLNRLTVRSEIPATEAADLKPGAEAHVLASPPVTAALSFVSPTVDTNNGTVLTRAELPPDSGLRPGQFVQLRILTGTHVNCLAAPVESVVKDMDGHSVIELVSGEEVKQTPVEIGYQEDGWVEIEGAGIKEGASVVTVGAYGLPDKTKIQVAAPPDASAQTNSAPSK